MTLDMKQEETAMTRKYWLDLTPSLLLGVGIVVSTSVAVRGAESGSLVLFAPLALAAAVMGSDALDSRLRGDSWGPSWAALILAGAIMTLRDPSLFKTLIPVIGAASWVILLLRSRGRRKSCRGV